MKEGAGNFPGKNRVIFSKMNFPFVLNLSPPLAADKFLHAGPPGAYASEGISQKRKGVYVGYGDGYLRVQ